MCHLLNYWGRLEQRTKQVIDILSNAAKERCRIKDGEQKDSSLRRKERDKQKKSLAAIDEILTRGKDNNNSDVQSNNAYDTIYSPIITMIEEKANMRRLWKEREHDRVFKYISYEYKPIEVPFRFNVIGASNVSSKEKVDDFYGESPLPGSHEELKIMTHDLKQFGRAFMSQNSSHLPATEKKVEVSITNHIAQDVASDVKIDMCEEDILIPEERKEVSNEGLSDEKSKIEEKRLTTKIKLNPAEHKKESDWNGWKKHIFGLEMQQPWSQYLLNGKKTIETRTYDLPKALIGKKLFILESKSGEDGISSIGNYLDGDEISDSINVVGWVIFDRVIIYRYRSKFEADEEKHMVKRDSGYGWKDDTRIVYGWVVSKKAKLNIADCKNTGKKKSFVKVQSMARRMRSLFSLEIIAPDKTNCK